MSSPPTSDLSDPLSPPDSDADELGTPVPSSRPSVDMGHGELDRFARPAKRRRTGGGGQGLATATHSSLISFEPAPASLPTEEEDNISLSSDGFSSAPGSPSQNEYALRDEAQTLCMWKDCLFGEAMNNDDLVQHVQATHCATGGPKKMKFICEWGECQKKTTTHPSGYALKAHMRSHTKEKPYYCALPECDKAFTRSDALAKHMRTVHEPEPPKGAPITEQPTPSGKSKGKSKQTNGSANTKASDPNTSHILADENGNDIDPSNPNDNISYIPAFHPITRQPGFMINYPPDIDFSVWESSIPAFMLMRLLRRQLHWAEQDGEELRREIDALEAKKKDEWLKKEILLEGVLEAEMARGERKGLLDHVDRRVHDAMLADLQPSRHLPWSAGDPIWRREPLRPRHPAAAAADDTVMLDHGDSPAEAEEEDEVDGEDEEEEGDENDDDDDEVQTPPPTRRSGGFDGDDDPFDNYVASRTAEFYERERLRSLQNTPQNSRSQVPAPVQGTDEADAAGALLGLSES